MKPSPEFSDLPKSFWAHVRSISQQVGYTVRGQNQIKVPTIAEMRKALVKLDLDPERIATDSNAATSLGNSLHSYFSYRAEVINNHARTHLMTAVQAKALFDKLRKKRTYGYRLTMNKQKGEKAMPSYLTCIVNMLIESNIGDLDCDYDPRTLTTVTDGSVPIRTLARRVDGAFPGSVNPIAIWEIKEYYYTTTFGSRIADGIYETLLDGMELEELRHSENIDVKHYLIIDAYHTWWDMGKSYLCRVIDMLHMGYIDEVLFGKEVVTALPEIIQSWRRLLKQRQ